MMTADIDELDINPFYHALQTSHLKYFENAQENCHLICVPVTTSLNGVSISTKLINTHILKPSPYFKGQYYTSCSKEKVFHFDENKNELYSKGDIDCSRTKILNEEIGYNKDYEPYRILIIDKPLDPNIKPSKNNNKINIAEIVLPKQSAEERHKWLASFPEFQPIIRDIDTNLKKFHRNYMVLPHFLENTSKYLMDLSEDSVKRCCISTTPPFHSDARLLASLGFAIECYINESVYPKIFPVICEKFSKADELVLTRCAELASVDNRQLSIDNKFDCDLSGAVLSLKKLDSLFTPLEKLLCIKATLDHISEGINNYTEQMNIFRKNSCQSVCITSDDLIPILAKVIIHSKSRHLESNIYYMDVFNWNFASKDKDNLSYCLVTLKAAVLYMIDFNFSTQNENTNTSENILNQNYLKHGKDNEQPRCLLQGNKVTQPSSLDEKMDRITRRLKGFQMESNENKKTVKSIFGDSYNKKISIHPKKETAMAQSTTKQNPDLGEFLSRVQDDIFGETCGKLT